ncbi:MAG TPA: aminotransferase class V-fold PLP-dependent enzyme [Gaiellales bacterium]
MTSRRHPLLDHAPPTPAEFAAVELNAQRVLRTDDDVVIVQAEAALALEAVLAGLVRPGIRALCLSSGTYGAWFANELAQLGAEVTTIAVDSRDAVSAADVAAALERDPAIELVAFVHAESLSGNVNPAEEICAVVRAHGALCIVDAVASIGAHALEVSRWGIDVCIGGPQKALAGSSGTSLVSVSERAWDALRANPGAPRNSFLSLLDWKDRWIDAGRVQIPGTPSVVEMLALAAALDRVLDEGLDQTIARHARVARGCRAGVRALGLELWPLRDEVAANAVTVVAVPDGVDAEAVRSAASRHGLALVPGRGALAGKILRIDHMGIGATPEHVLAVLIALGAALRETGSHRDVASAVSAAAGALV